MVRPVNIASEKAKIENKIKRLEKKDAKAISAHQSISLEIESLKKKLAEIEAK